MWFSMSNCRKCIFLFNSGQAFLSDIKCGKENMWCACEFSPVRHTGDRSLWWSSVCRVDQLWAPCVSQSAWRGNTAGPDPESAPPSPEDPPPDGARRISTGRDGEKKTHLQKVFSFRCCSFLKFVSTHLDVKGRLRGEVSEGARNHDSGTLATKRQTKIVLSK